MIGCAAVPGRRSPILPRRELPLSQMSAKMLAASHRLLEIPQVYRLSQLFALPTIRRFRFYLGTCVPRDPQRRILEIGCGIGSYRPYFECDYTGIDINPDYVRIAKQQHNGSFFVMDATDMGFEPDSFADSVSIATTHHLDDERLAAMVRSAMRLAPTLHIIDAILPVSARAHFKDWWFRMDRGQYPRRFDQLRQIVGGCAELQRHEICEGPLHDVCYLRASRGRTTRPGRAGDLAATAPARSSASMSGPLARASSP